MASGATAKMTYKTEYGACEVVNSEDLAVSTDIVHHIIELQQVEETTVWITLSR